jgi:hypothetical protein
MSIVLRDLRAAVQNYLDTHVTVTVSPLTPAVGVTIQPNEPFTFDVTGTNLSGPDAIKLVNVRYHIWVENPAIAKLVVPTHNPNFNGITYKGWTSTPDVGLFLVNLPANAEVAEMYLFPPASGPFPQDKAGDLNPGDSDSILGLKGKAGPAAGGGSTQITCRIQADPDLDFLFPKNEDSPTVTQTLTVVG